MKRCGIICAILVICAVIEKGFEHPDGAGLPRGWGIPDDRVGPTA